MIKDILANTFAHEHVECSGAETLVKDAQSGMMKGLISRAGDLNKNNDRLKFALCSIRFPEAYEEERAKLGHPTMFLRILHYALFGASKVVKKHLFSKEVDPDTIHLNDYKFFKQVLYILINLFGYKPTITLDQFFRYGFAEMKMLLCCDTINLVKRKHKHILTMRSLSAKRSVASRSSAGGFGTVSTISHELGKSQSYYYERDSTKKVARVSRMDDRLLPRSIDRAEVNRHAAGDRHATSDLGGSTGRSHRRERSFEITQRLLGSPAHQMKNRHAVKEVSGESPVKKDEQKPLRYRYEKAMSNGPIVNTPSKGESAPRAVQLHQGNGSLTDQDMDVRMSPEKVTFAEPDEVESAIDENKEDKEVEEAQEESVSQVNIQQKEEKQQVIPESLLHMLQDSISNLNSKFETLQSSIDTRLTAISSNYTNLESRIDQLANQKSEQEKRATASFNDELEGNPEDRM